MSERCVFVANGQLEAEQVRLFLEAAGIPTRLAAESLTITHGLTISDLGAVEVRVAEADEGRARELLTSADRGELRLGDEADVSDGT